MVAAFVNKNEIDIVPSKSERAYFDEDKISKSKSRQPVKRRSFADDDSLPLKEVIKKRVISRRYDMNAMNDDDISPESNSEMV